MNSQLEKIKNEAIAAIGRARDENTLTQAEIRALGRKGALTEFLRDLGRLAPEQRRAAGEEGNALKKELESVITRRRAELQKIAASGLAEREWLDVTAPGRELPAGHLHLTTQAIREITSIFSRLGYNCVSYPEVEWDWYAFESLNMPKDHTARDEWETFFLSGPSHHKFGRLVLTPHTSSGQVREMERGELPIRMVNIAKCYRRQSDVNHLPMFHQFEGLLIDKNIAITHLKGTLDYFAREFFGAGRRTRLRPFHFRFTEPSFEIDVSCGVCGGTGESRGGRCRVCKQGWLELGGAGMVHPNVLRAGGVDPREWGGFAFGWGVERTRMMKSAANIDDIRVLYKNDARFLEQF
ncbi:phenylalanine--tRNA ligase subunit alpha [Patescibacteria group bacterium]|nr:MAG: phenylalanine--tRNA ligase subunit alpha [Patescibacteria group bacterium]